MVRHGRSGQASLPALALLAAALFPALDLWIEATEYVERHAYAERVEKTLCEVGETRVLVLGAAGMTLGRGAPCALDVAFVDIDPAQERIAEIFLQTAPSTFGTFYATDARAFLRSGRSGPFSPTARRGPSESRRGTHDGDRAIYSDAVLRADLDRSLR